ncbi:MAG: signal recognition particle-docking protein FtsY [Bacteriovoracaceae bacterium]
MSLELILIIVSVIAAAFFGLYLKNRPAKLTPTQKKILEEKIPFDVAPSQQTQSEKKTPITEVEPVKPTGPTWQERLSKGLARTRTEIFSKMENLIGGSKLTVDQIDEMEEILYTADMGPATVSDLIAALKKEVKEKELDQESLKKFLYAFLKEKMHSVQDKVDQSLYQHQSSEFKTKVIMIVGVNGAGKTTTIGKLATKLTNQGASVYVGACDTFRAAAVDQLQVWCERAGATMIRAKDGSDPSGVAYEALAQAVAAKADYCILDTAGRLHTKTNLMEELAKTKRVLSKVDSTAPHSVLLVIDAITGQNALKQAEEFNKALSLTGLVFTKCDGSAKAGNAISIVNSLQVPIVYIGVGEQVEDLEIFNLEDYLGTLLGIQTS